mmetsp:Transcript_17353/g.17041  ORF Transcript_17353/g.17041 Transcript_17353/m.17041 type:complete len:142 (+) Transcript_17353:514-939(+)
MKKFKWSVKKSIEFMYQLRPTMNFGPTIIAQLKSFEKINAKLSLSSLLEGFDHQEQYKEEEILLSNTYLNIINTISSKSMRKQSKTDEETLATTHTIEKQVRWVDEELGQDLATFVPDNSQGSSSPPMIRIRAINSFGKNF